MLRKALKHKIVTALSAASLAFVLGGFFWVWTELSSSGSGPFILHFDDLRGITQVGGLGIFIFMGVFGSVVVLMNFFIGLELAERDRFLALLTTSLTLLFAILLFIGFAAILNVN